MEHTPEKNFGSMQYNRLLDPVSRYRYRFQICRFPICLRSLKMRVGVKTHTHTHTPYTLTHKPTHGRADGPKMCK